VVIIYIYIYIYTYIHSHNAARVITRKNIREKKMNICCFLQNPEKKYNNDIYILQQHTLDLGILISRRRGLISDKNIMRLNVLLHVYLERIDKQDQRNIKTLNTLLGLLMDSIRSTTALHNVSFLYQRIFTILDRKPMLYRSNTI